MVPDLTRPGHISSDHLTDNSALLTYADGEVRYRHLCDRGARGVIVCAPALQIGEGHALTRNADGLATVRASILCGDCGAHGWVTNGEWADC